MALTVVAGDLLTGNPDGLPDVRYSRGREARLHFPQSQTVIFNQGFFPLAPRRETWMFLHYHDARGSLKAELSLPLALTDGGYVTGWRERIILDSDEIASLVRIIPQAEMSPEIDIPVHMKA